MIRRSILVGISVSCLFACSDASTPSGDGSLDNELSKGKTDRQPPSQPGDPANSPEAPLREGEPRFVEGNPSSCASVIPEAADLLTFKIDPAKSGTYTSADGALTVSIDAAEKTFSFTSDVPLRWVVVKGGPGANVYAFSPPVGSADGLVAPNDKGLSHLDFCYPPPGNGGGGAGGGGGRPGTGGTATAGGGSGGSGTGGDGSAGDDGDDPCPDPCQR
jgi:hypothetical protein